MFLGFFVSIFEVILSKYPQNFDFLSIGVYVFHCYFRMNSV